MVPYAHFLRGFIWNWESLTSTCSDVYNCVLCYSWPLADGTLCSSYWWELYVSCCWFSFTFILYSCSIFFSVLARLCVPIHFPSLSFACLLSSWLLDFLELFVVVPELRAELASLSWELLLACSWFRWPLLWPRLAHRCHSKSALKRSSLNCERKKEACIDLSKYKWQNCC